MCDVCGTAHAKLMMHEEVTVQDAVCAVSVMESSMQVICSHLLPLFHVCTKQNLLFFLFFTQELLTAGLYG